MRKHILFCPSRAQHVLCKDVASECNESLFSYCRVQHVLCKDVANEYNESLFSYCRAQHVLCKDNYICSKSFIHYKIIDTKNGY